MPFIGNQPADKFLTLEKQVFTTSATDTYTLDREVSSVNDIELFLNNVRQEPTEAYTISGTTLTLASAITASDSMYCIYQGRAVGTQSPAVGSVTNAMLQNSSITLNGSAVSLGGSATVGGNNTPYFSAYLGSDQTGVGHETWTKVQINTEVVDEGGYFDTSNYRWTPPVGVYLIGAYLYGYDTDSSTPSSRRVYSEIRKNGTNNTPLIFSGISGDSSNTAPDAEFKNFTASISTIINQTNASDYWELWGYVGNDNGDSNNGFAGNFTAFWGFKLIGA